MYDDLCWFAFFFWFGVGGWSCSSLLASTVGLRAYAPKEPTWKAKQLKCATIHKDST